MDRKLAWQAQPWLRMTVEGATIVASILLAFAIDAAWDRHEARRSADESLARVLDEIALAREELELGGQVAARYRDGTRQLLEVVGAAERDAVVTVPDTMLHGVLVMRVDEPPAAATRHFIASDAFDEIRHPALRRSIMGWVPMLEDQRDDQEGTRQLLETQIQPLMRREFDVARAARLIQDLEIAAGPIAPGEVGTTELRATAELHAMLVELHWRHRIDEYQRGLLLDLARQIREMGEAALR